jgi:hypothetical protein
MPVEAGLALENANFLNEEVDYRATGNCYDTVDIKALCVTGRHTGLIARFTSL